MEILDKHVKFGFENAFRFLFYILVKTVVNLL